MNYTELQKSLIEKYRIVYDPESICWERCHAHIDGSRRICKHHIKESYNSLYELLHEIGHIESNTRSMKRAEEESEATFWCHRQLKELGLPIKRKQANRYKEYIAMTYNRGMRRGLKKRIKSKLYL